MSNLENTIQSALDDVGRSEHVINRAENDISVAVAAKALEVIGSHDVIITEADKLGATMLGIEIARSIVDLAASGFGKGITVPRHILAESLGDPSQLQHYIAMATKSVQQTVETSVLKRVRQRNERGLEFERKNTAPRTREEMPIRTEPGVWTGDGGGKYPAKRGKK